MISSFEHIGFRRRYETGSTAGVQSAHAKRLRLQLTALDSASTIDDMEIPGFRLHPLKGKLKGRWAISVSRNWRLTFELRDGNVYFQDYEDYH
ncbi:MAG: type II toxin-antitoxin system RelE/ParE family toxin [Burkholderiaceae bacterium]